MDEIHCYRLFAVGIQDSYLIVVVHQPKRERNKIVADATLISSLHPKQLTQSFSLSISDEEPFKRLVPYPKNELLSIAHQWALGHLDLAYLDWFAKRFPAAAVRQTTSIDHVKGESMLVQLWLRGKHDGVLDEIAAGTRSPLLKEMIRSVRQLPRIEATPH